MEDKEVGELHRQVVRAPGLQNHVDSGLFIALIRKLVDERISVLIYRGYGYAEARQKALHSFGLEEVEFCG